MALVDMKVAEQDNAPVDISQNSYGYGLCISLTDDQVEALGLEKNYPAAGSVVSINAIAKVVQVRLDAEEGDDDKDIDVSLQLQITAMEVTPSQTNSAEVLYGPKK